jgi:hypothetical protein
MSLSVPGRASTQHDGRCHRRDGSGALPVPCAQRDEIERDAAGRYLLACTSTAPDGTPVADIVRITADGQPDPRFGTAGVARLPGAIAGAAAVTLPGGRILALGGPPPVAGATPVLVTTVLDHRGHVLSSQQQELDQVEEVPPEYRNGVLVTVVAEPTRDGAVVAVHASTLLTITDVFRPADPFLLLFDAAGHEAGRIEGPRHPLRRGLLARTRDGRAARPADCGPGGVVAARRRPPPRHRGPRRRRRTERGRPRPAQPGRRPRRRHRHRRAGALAAPGAGRRHPHLEPAAAPGFEGRAGPAAARCAALAPRHADHG